jgi:hypothetical protein
MVNVDEILTVEQNALIADFPPEMPIEDKVFAEINERFEELADKPQVDTHISVLRMESPMNTDVFERAQEAAEAGTEFDITNWIIVSEGIKKRALEGKIGEIPGVETATANTKAEALELATV